MVEAPKASTTVAGARIPWTISFEFPPAVSETYPDALNPSATATTARLESTWIPDRACEGACTVRRMGCLEEKVESVVTTSSPSVTSNPRALTTDWSASSEMEWDLPGSMRTLKGVSILTEWNWSVFFVIVVVVVVVVVVELVFVELLLLLLLGAGAGACCARLLVGDAGQCRQAPAA